MTSDKRLRSYDEEHQHPDQGKAQVCQDLGWILSAVQFPAIEIYIINRTTHLYELTRSHQLQVDWVKHNHITSSESTSYEVQVGWFKHNTSALYLV